MAGLIERLMVLDTIVSNFLSVIIISRFSTFKREGGVKLLKIQEICSGGKFLELKVKFCCMEAGPTAGGLN